MLLALGNPAVCYVLKNVSLCRCACNCVLKIIKSLKNVLYPDLTTVAGLTIPTGLDKTYERQFTLVQSSNMSSRRTVELKHYPGGPVLLVDCCRFYPTVHYQTRAVWKNSSGWYIAQTTAFC